MNLNETKKETQATKTVDLSKTPRCFNCGAVSKDRLLLSCAYKDESCYVCARCLPMFIHGAME